MELHWLRREGCDGLVLFVLGWAADHRVVEHIRPEGCDVLVVYDYADGIGSREELAGIVAGYRRAWLFAWSFGVWVAERLLSGVTFTRAVALNGTPRPVDQLYGIEPRRMAVTMRGLRAGGMEPFDRRAYGEHFERMKPILSPRPLSQNIAELEYLVDASAASAPRAEHSAEPTAHIGEALLRWDKAFIGSGDEIFSPENMLRFWGSRAEIIPLPHYPFADGEIIEKEIEGR